MGPGDGTLRDTLQKAARLCKADLVTGMVGEFPELQGVMGKYYAEKSGEPKAVAQAIEEHYLPRFSGDRLPQSEAGLILAIADRLDTICGMFGIGKQPTGSADPFGLRRAALGVIQLVLHAKQRFSLLQMVQWAFNGLASKVPVPPIDPVLEFFRARLKALWGEDHRPDVVEAILSADFDDLLGAQQRLQALSEIVGRPDFLPLATAFKRAVNILGQAPAGDLEGEIAPGVLKEDAGATTPHPRARGPDTGRSAARGQRLRRSPARAHVAQAGDRPVLREGDGDGPGRRAAAQPAPAADVAQDALLPLRGPFPDPGRAAFRFGRPMITSAQ